MSEKESEKYNEISEYSYKFKLYMLTIEQRSTLFRFYIAALGFYFAGIFLIIDKISTCQNDSKKLLFLVLLIFLGFIATRISYKFELAADWSHTLIEKFRIKYKDDFIIFFQDKGENQRGYNQTFKYIYKLGRLTGWSISVYSVLFLIYRYLPKNVIPVVAIGFFVLLPLIFISHFVYKSSKPKTKKKSNRFNCDCIEALIYFFWK